MRLGLVTGLGQRRFWRPFPRETVDVICGEGDVATLPVHAHEAVEVILPLSRFALTDGAGRARVASAGEIHVAAPFELRGARSIDGGPCAARLLLVSPALWPGAARGPRQFVVKDPGLYAELWSLIDDLRGPLVSLACGTRLLGCLRRLLTAEEASPATAAPQRAHVDGVRRVCDYLHEHIADAVSLDELARVAHLSKFYLLRAFRRAYGVTPHAYQMQLRLAHAWRLIVDGQPLSRTTYDAGFADQSHLTRRFADAFGLTPARYARQLALPPGNAGMALETERPSAINAA